MGRPKLNRDQLQVRVAPATPEKLKKLAVDLGFIYGGNGHTGRFLDAIANLDASQLKELISEGKY
ncbi:MAG: hypothetical protein AB4372_19785 [Xenococcus sp. (in: cyanobacteria)]